MKTAEGQSVKGRQPARRRERERERERVESAVAGRVKCVRNTGLIHARREEPITDWPRCRQSSEGRGTCGFFSFFLSALCAAMRKISAVLLLSCRRVSVFPAIYIALFGELSSAPARLPPLCAARARLRRFSFGFRRSVYTYLYIRGYPPKGFSMHRRGDSRRALVLCTLPAMLRPLFTARLLLELCFLSPRFNFLFLPLPP